MLLIFPPVAKPCEPPAGIAKLAGALKAHDISSTILDANLEGLLFLLQQPKSSAQDTWTRRSLKNISNNLASLRGAGIYRSFSRYRRAVQELQRALEVSAEDTGAILGLADFHERDLSPVRSVDLVSAATHPEKNPYFPYFSKRLPEIIAESSFSWRRPLLLLGAGPGRKERQKDRDNKEDTAGLNIGFSLNYLSQALTAFAMIGYIKQQYPHVKVVLGGGLVSSWMKRPGFKNPFGGLVDHLICGPGEGPLLDLFDVKEPKLHRATPDYSGLPLQEYLSPGFILPYSGSSGCYWRKCSFCPETAEDNHYLPIPAPQAMTELQSLVAETRPLLVHLLDNSISPALMQGLSHDALGVPWYGFARISKDLLDKNYCIALKRSGCAMLKLGLESGDQGILDGLQKGIDLGVASEVFKNLKQVGIATYIYLLFGTPAETIAEARKTLEFVVQHADAISYLNVAIFNMPLCSVDAGTYETEQFYDGDLSLYTGFKHPLGWDRKIVRHFLETEFKRHPKIAAILKNDPPVFTSNHATFFPKY
ncbi:MAG TPA: radical SAM protein [Nitrospirota bacterium]|nr:radical SAM protein [Nitrospirota bacterium]